MKCNLDCSYCGSGLYAGHDNSQRHPPLEDCLRTIDFMYEYVDRLMSQRRSGIRHVVLNIYGGESLHHPHIVAILQAARQRHQAYQDRWNLTIGTTTNAIVTRKKMAQIIPLIDKFTVSYHSETSPAQKSLFRENILQIAQGQRDAQCVVLMHSDPQLFADSQQQIAWCEQNNIKYLPRQLDHGHMSKYKYNYNDQQVVWFDKLYKQRSRSDTQVMLELSKDQDNNTDLADTGRACCGGRQLCENANHSDRKFFVVNKFTGWYCSVDQFFLYVKQTTGEVFVNKDCKMNYDGKKGAIGHLSQCESMLATVGQTPTIQCARNRCLCGLCAPKAQDISTYNEIMSKYLL